MPVISVPQQPSRVIPTWEFLMRLTDDEAVSIDLASYGATEDAALVRRYTRFTTGTLNVDLDSPTVLQSMQGLVNEGLISQERMSEILA